MKLHSVEILSGVFHCGNRAVISSRRHVEAFGRSEDSIRMAHPHDGIFIDAAKEFRRADDFKLRSAVFADLRGLDFTAENVRHCLCTVANP